MHGILRIWLLLGLAVAHPVQAQTQATNAITSLTTSVTNLGFPDVNQLLQSTNVIPRDSAASVREMSLLDDKQKLGAGDKVSFRVIEDQEDPKELFVSEAGDLDIPYIGLVSAQNRTCREVAMEAKQLLEKEYYYQATVIISLLQVNKTRTMGRVYVTGQVRMSGPQDIPGTEVYTVSKAILKAGGFTDFADKRRVRLVRKAAADGSQKKTFEINVEDIFRKGKTENDVVVEADDLIYVGQRAVNF
ncbi:MAG TPA: polysaccharide biosynthesis/export family protein [Candidatus Paceibacterota bacterium]|nr:polysaccharide biosynthesis/export family protein [Candidatus Paceibacterota bacterium]